MSVIFHLRISLECHISLARFYAFHCDFKIYLIKCAGNHAANFITDLNYHVHINCLSHYAKMVLQ